MTKFNPQRLIFGLFLLVLIVIAELAFGATGLPAWPAFMVMIFFFMEHMNVKKIPDILIGGCFGIACIIMIKVFIHAFAPTLGVEFAKILFICIAVYAIVAFGEIWPVLFNNYGFMFFTISGLGISAPDPHPLVWIAVELVAGGLLIAGVIGIVKIMGLMAGPASDPAEAGRG